MVSLIDFLTVLSYHQGSGAAVRGGQVQHPDGEVPLRNLRLHHARRHTGGFEKTQHYLIAKVSLKLKVTLSEPEESFFWELKKKN